MRLAPALLGAVSLASCLVASSARSVRADEGLALPAPGAKAPRGFSIRVQGGDSGDESIRVEPDGKFTITADGRGPRAAGTFTGELTPAERAELEKAYPGLQSLPQPTAADAVVGPQDTRTTLEFVGADGKPRRLDVNTKFIIRPELKDFARFTRFMDRVAPPAHGDLSFVLATPAGTRKITVGEDGGTVKIEVGDSSSGVAFVGSLTAEEKQKILAARAAALELPAPSATDQSIAPGSAGMELCLRDRVDAKACTVGNQGYMMKNRAGLQALVEVTDAVFKRLSQTTQPSATPGFATALGAAH